MLLLASILYLIISILNLELGLLILITLLPSYLLRFEIGPLPSNFLEVMIIIFVIVWLVKTIKQKNLKTHFKELKEKISKPLLIFISLFVISATISIFISANAREALGIWKAYFIEPIILFFIILTVFKNKKDVQKIIWALTISAFLVSILAIYQKFTGWNVPYSFWGKDNVYRVTSFYGFPNAIGLFLAPIITLNIGQIFKEHFKGYSNLFRIIVVITSILAVVWAVSEGAIVGIIAGVFLVGILTKKTRWLTLTVTLVLILTVLFTPTLKDKIQPKIFLKDVSGQIRVQIWQETGSMLRNKPLTGAGLASYQTTIEPYHVGGVYIKTDDPDFLSKVLFDEEYRKQAWQPIEIYLYPHNFVLNFWSEIGLLGLIAIIAILIKFYWLGFKNLKSPLAIPLLGAMTAMIVHGLVDVPYFKNDLAILFWLIIGLMIVNQQLTKQKIKV